MPEPDALPPEGRPKVPPEERLTIIGRAMPRERTGPPPDLSRLPVAHTGPESYALLKPWTNPVPERERVVLALHGCWRMDLPGAAN